MGSVELFAMSGWDEFCTVCAGPPHIFFDGDVETGEGKPSTSPARPNPDDYTWLESLIGISNKEEVIPLGAYNGWGSFDIIPHTSPYYCFGIGCRNLYGAPDDEKTAKGYACHVACYNLLQKELNYTLKYADLLPLHADDEYDFNKFAWCDYGGLTEYQDHEGLFEEDLVRDGKLWMVEDPSENAQNKERILQVWRPLVESGFKRPDARVGDEGRAPDVAENEHGRVGDARVGDEGTQGSAPEIAKNEHGRIGEGHGLVGFQGLRI